MPRYYKDVSLEELQDAIAHAFRKEEPQVWGMLTPQIEKDLKVAFDCENCYDSDDERLFEGLEGLIGYHRVGGLSFLGLLCGGDWEVPVFWVIYMDPKGSLRAYVPTDGNLYNTTTMEAYGNDQEADYLDWNDNHPDSQIGDEDEELPDGGYDAARILADIQERLEKR